MFLNDNQYFYVYFYCGKCSLGQIRPPPCKSLPQKILKIFLLFFFHFRCILLQISHKKCVFFISISILGRSGVNTTIDIVLMVKPTLQTTGAIIFTAY